MSQHPECPTCVCGRRASVHDDGLAPGPGSIMWTEHLLAWSAYSNRFGLGQGRSAERMAERGGFSYGELTNLLGHAPETWAPVPVKPEGFR